MDSVGHYSRPELLRLVVDRTAPRLISESHGLEPRAPLRDEVLDANDVAADPAAVS
jgi:hypothetical protein